MASTFMNNRGEGGMVSPATRSTTSIVAIVAAIASFVMSGRGQEFIALFLAVVAIGAGLVGGLRALSPQVKGGILSIIAVVLGVIAIVAAVIALIL
jgi:uncharacterized membrane protein HdeD (DUF308 family)